MEQPGNANEKGAVNLVLQQEVERVMGARRWSLQQAEIVTGIPASTINRMRKGLNVKPSTVIRFGKAVGENESHWANVALDLPETGEDVPTPPPARDPTADIPPDLLEYIRDPAVAELVRFYAGVPPAQRDVARQAFKGLAEGLGGRRETAGDVVRRQQEARTIGKRADRDEKPSRDADSSSE